MRVSLWLPTFTHGSPDFRTLSQRARKAENFGYSGIYLLDHLLPISGVHTSAWFDPIVGLSVLATSTGSVTIGTASLIAGFRHPVLLAKQLASIAMLAGPRLALGVASGWYAPEYEALGYRIEERRGRTDETLEALDLLMTRDVVSFEGKYWQFRNVEILPKPDFRVPILVGGGSRTPDAGSDFDASAMQPSVLSRIVRWDGWLAPCAGQEDLTYEDLALVRAALVQSGRDMKGFTLAHVQWTHIVDTRDRDRALREQLPAFRALMGEQHRNEHFLDTYLVGAVDDITARIARLRDHGFHEIIVAPVTHDESQIELIADKLIPVASQESQSMVTDGGAVDDAPGLRAPDAGGD